MEVQDNFIFFRKPNKNEQSVVINNTGPTYKDYSKLHSKIKKDVKNEYLGSLMLSNNIVKDVRIEKFINCENREMCLHYMLTINNNNIKRTITIPYTEPWVKSNDQIINRITRDIANYLVSLMMPDVVLGINR